MTTPIATGHGATITFATSTFTASIISIGGFEMSRGKLDKTHLTSGAYRQYIPGDVIDAGSFTIDFFYDWDVQPPINAPAELVTIKVPTSHTGIIDSDSPSIAANAFFESFTTPELVTGSLMRAQGSIVWATGPTFTDQGAA